MEFENLAPEVIEQICEKMDLQTLGRYQATSLRSKEICQRVLDKKNIENLIQNYSFDDESQRIYDSIVKRAKPDNTLFKIKFFARGGEFHATLNSTDICNVYFKGNIYRAILAIQKYFYNDSKFNFLNEILSEFQETAYDIFLETNEYILSQEEGYSPKFEEIQKNPELYNEYIELVVDQIDEGIEENRPIAIIQTEISKPLII